jgi:membrane protein YqaA with SNARE-associated domain
MLTLLLTSFLAATFLPFSSEAHLAYLKTQGESFPLLVIVATAGNTFGGMFTYYLGRLGKLEWSQRFLRIDIDQIESAKLKLNKMGTLLAFFCWLPIVGDVFAFVLGLARASLLKTLIFMSVGKALRYIAVIYFLEEIIRVFS